jgi:hypothetical protein
MRCLARLIDVGFGACFLRSGFLAGSLALGLGLVLLGPTLFFEVVVAGKRTGCFFGLTFDVFDDAFDAFANSVTVLGHSLTSRRKDELSFPAYPNISEPTRVGSNVGGRLVDDRGRDAAEPAALGQDAVQILGLPSQPSRRFP